MLNEKSCLEVPEEIPAEESYKKLSFNQKKQVIENILYKIFELNKNRQTGITVDELVKNLTFSKNAILRALIKLLASRDIYSIKGRPNRYYKNGRVSHHFLNSSIILKDQRFDFRLFANDFGKIFVFLQEMNNDIFSENQASGGIIIEADSFNEFVGVLIEKSDIVQEEIFKFKNKLKEMID